LFDLLKLKLNIKSEKTELPRGRDINDIYNLVGVAEKKGISPKDIIKTLTTEQKHVLRTLLHLYEQNHYRLSEEILIHPDRKYLNSIIRLTK
jgi:hypothetical protein